MKFLDEATIEVSSGKGGAGCISFRREANLPRGGPDGGDGGYGGDVTVECISNLNTLIDFRYKPSYRAKNGRPGAGKCRSGASAAEIILKVPVGTEILTEDGAIIADLTREGQRAILAKGGRGGLGNTRFKSSTNRTPRRSTEGSSGEERKLTLRLKLLADAGLVGLPNAGKSTFLRAVSSAQPKVADYPFTTLHPQLGVVLTDGLDFVLADVPGLVANSSQGTGLGHRFLGHLERCRVLVHLVDATLADVGGQYQTIRNEISAYGHGLDGKKEIVGLNKIDAIPADMRVCLYNELRKVSGVQPCLVSGMSGEGVNELLGLTAAATRGHT